MTEAAPILCALQRILEHSLFRNSTRLSQFLRFIVEETVAGRADQIKEYTIGVRIYERGADFDPKVDAIVRVEASRLRGKLKQYYTTDGGEDPVRITLPTGSYVPAFAEMAASVSAPPESSRRSAEPAHPVTHETLAAPSRQPRFAPSVRSAALLVLAGTALAFASWRISRPSDPTFRVTVVPFSNLTGDPAQNAATAGFTEQLASRLLGEPGIRVVQAPGSSGGATLRGSLQNGDNERRLVVHLDAAGAQVWSATLHSGRLATGQFEEMASDLIARTLKSRFGGRPVAASLEPLPRNQAAADLFVRGHKEWETQTREGVHNAAEFFRRAAEQDPRYAGAWAELGAATLYLAYLEPVETAHWNAEARIALLKALSLDDRNAEAHVRLGNLYLEHDWNFAAAERELQLGIWLAPGADAATRWFALAACLRGHPEAARRELQYALLLNPASPILLAEVARLDLQLGRIDEAGEFARASLARSEQNAPAHFVMGLVDEAHGDLAAARIHFEACGSARAWPFDCRASLARLNGVDPTDTLPRHYSRALLDLAARRNDAALTEIREGLRSHEMFIEYVCLDPQFRSLFRGLKEQPCSELNSWIPQRP